jgi:hypothetical protein
MSTATSTGNPQLDSKTLQLKTARQLVPVALFAVAAFHFIGTIFVARPPTTQQDLEMGRIWHFGVPAFFAVLGLWAAFAPSKAPALLGFFIYGLLTLLDLMLCQQGTPLIVFLAMKAVAVVALLGTVQYLDKASREAAKATG